MKHCNKCDTTKEDSEFNKNNNKPDGLQAYCRSCAKKNSAKHFQDNKQSYYDKRDKIRDIRRDDINKLKSDTGCYGCGMTEPACLDFHHLTDKFKNVSTMVTSLSNMNKIKEEINKCIVLCSNCHRKLHYYNLTIEELKN